MNTQNKSNITKLKSIINTLYNLNPLCWYKHWSERRIVQQSTITEAQWHRAFTHLPLLHALSEKDKKRLKKLAILFIYEKDFAGAQGLEVNQHMKILIALQACLPILELGIEWYRGWVSIIIYPAAYWSEQTYHDAAGVAHSSMRPLSGEAWLRGPVILSWEDTKHAGEIDGDNLVIHEFAHKLDMLNGQANGYPPLHKGMSHDTWVKNFTQAYEHFQLDMDNEERAEINRYAAYSPAEFFAVLSEVFFEQPLILKEHYSNVYDLMSLFYKQNPLVWSHNGQRVTWKNTQTSY